MSILAIIIIVLLVAFLFGGLSGLHSYNGPYPIGIGGILLLVLIILLLTGRI